MPSPDLTRSKILFLKCVFNVALGDRLLLSHVYVLCPLLPYTGYTAYKLNVNLHKPTSLRKEKNSTISYFILYTIITPGPT